MEKEKILNDLRRDGFSLVHVEEVINILNSFEEVKNFMNNLIQKEEIVHRAKLLKLGNPVRDRTKYYEFQNQQLLGEGVSLDNSPILQFYLQDLFMDVAEEYLETKEVRIRNCLAFYHPENPFPPANSQNWHRDTEDTKILKAFLYCNDVSEENGSLWYVKNSKHGSRNDYIWPNVGKAKHGYLDLESVMKIPYNDILKLEGKSGTICFFDANGFHKGGNVRSGYRISTHCCYLRSDAPHIVNGILPTFDYNSNANILDINSANYRSLTQRQKRFLQ
jgi:hypothetical protein